MAYFSVKAPIQALLLTSSLYAGYSFYKLTGPLGLGKLIVSDAKAGKLPRRDFYTGIGPIDKVLSGLNLFFWPIMSQQNAEHGIQAYQFGGQIASIWMLVMFEVSRGVHQNTIMSHTIVLLGLTLQVFTYAVCIPLWLLFYLSTYSASSEVAKSLPSPIDSDSIPISVILGFGIPAVLSAWPQSESLTERTKLGLMALWQVFPLWADLIHRFLRFTLLLTGFSRYTAVTTEDDRTRACRVFYVIAISIAILTHCVVVDKNPITGGVQHMLGFRFLKVPFFSSLVKPQTVGEGVAEFLAWDESIGSFATLAWVLYDLGNILSGQDLLQNIQALVGLLVLLVLGGPAGVILGARWARDELVRL